MCVKYTVHEVLFFYHSLKCNSSCCKLHWPLTTKVLFFTCFCLHTCTQQDLVSQTLVEKRKQIPLPDVYSRRIYYSERFFKRVKCWHWTHCLAVEGVLHRSFPRSTINICIHWIPACSDFLEDSFSSIVVFWDERPPEVGPLLQYVGPTELRVTGINLVWTGCDCFSKLKQRLPFISLWPSIFSQAFCASAYISELPRL